MNWDSGRDISIVFLPRQKGMQEWENEDKIKKKSQFPVYVYKHHSNQATADFWSIKYTFCITSVFWSKRTTEANYNLINHVVCAATFTVIFIGIYAIRNLMWEWKISQCIIANLLDSSLNLMKQTFCLLNLAKRQCNFSFSLNFSVFFFHVPHPFLSNCMLRMWKFRKSKLIRICDWQKFRR